MGISQDPVSSSPPPPSSSGTTGKPGPIGVPPTYTTPKIQHSSADAAERRGGPMYYEKGLDEYDDPNRRTYYDGDEYIPANWPANQIWQLQQALAKAGLLTGTFTRHTWDNATRNAYKELLALANAQGSTANNALMDMLRSAEGQYGADGTGPGGQRYKVDEFGNVVPVGGEEVAPLITRTTDPAALRRTFRKAVIDMLGEGWSQEEIDKMVAAYNQVEIQKQTEAYNLEQSGQAGTFTDMPSPEEFVASQVEAKDPEGVQEQGIIDNMEGFLNMAASPAWGVG